VDFGANAKETLKGQTGFPFPHVSTRLLDEGEEVYAFGYPLGSAVAHQMPVGIVGGTTLRPRVTSAIVASHVEQQGMFQVSGPVCDYVLDKALNYGNSGGPICAVATGHVHALCSRFQPVGIPQNHLKDAAGKPITIFIPSLYGVVSNVSHPRCIAQLTGRGIDIAST
jgi:serine protease Do